MSWWYRNSYLIAFVSAYFEWFAVAAWGVALARLASRRMKGREGALFATFVACIALELVQLTVDHGMGGQNRLSISRYFGPFGPMLWIFLAWVLHALWTVRQRALRYVARIAVAGFLLYVLIAKNVLFFIGQHEHGPAFDAYVAGALASEAITDDWDGPPRRKCMMYSASEYLTAELPAVFDTWGAAAWWVRGQSEGPNLNNYPYHPDYLLINDYEGYRGGQSRFRPEDYAKIQEIESTAHRWILVKRTAR